MRLPDFFVVGAPKTATTSLFFHLSSRADFGLRDPKEPGFFCYRDNRFILRSQDARPQELAYIVSESDFERAYGTVPAELLLGDFTTHYLYHSGTFLETTRRYFGDRVGDVPIIVVLRDPVDRAYSHYSMKVRDGQEHLSFKEAIQPDVIEQRLSTGFVPTFDYIGFSRYMEGIHAIEGQFKRVLKIDYRDLTERTPVVMRRVLSHLGVAGGETSDVIELPKHNVSGVPGRNPLKRAMHKALYQPSLLKRLLPNGVRAWAGVALKQRLGPLVLERQTLSEADRSAAAAMLSDECDFYRRFTQTDDSRP